MKVNILYKNPSSDNIAPIVGLSYTHNNAEYQVMKCFTSADSLIKHSQSEIDQLKEQIEINEEEALTIQKFEALKTQKEKLDYSITAWGLTSVSDFFFRLKLPIVKYSGSITLTPSISLLKKIERKDNLYYDLTNKRITTSPYKQ